MLQVLLNEFELQRQGNATLLAVSLRRNLPELRRSRDKPALKASIRHFDDLAAHYQGRLEAFLLGTSTEASWLYHDEEFVFRYASGGVLPVLEWGSVRYYCLFYRDVDPVGWNIANGATETTEELLDPRITVEREFCEEFVIADPAGGRVYRLECESPAASAASDARKHWASTLSGRHGRRFAQDDMCIEWVKGPDSLTVDDGVRKSMVPECFVNVNAIDFGIELDHVAAMCVHGEIVVCDGELLGERKINRPIGLFNVDRVHSRLSENASLFEPDILFHEGNRNDEVRLDEVVVSEYLPEQSRYRTEQDQAHFRHVCSRHLQYDLCPAARNVIRRFAAMTGDNRQLTAP